MTKVVILALLSILLLVLSVATSEARHRRRCCCPCCGADLPEAAPGPAPGGSPIARFDMYQDKKNEWRWRCVARNGRIIADSAEGYKHKVDCLHGIALLRMAACP